MQAVSQALIKNQIRTMKNDSEKDDAIASFRPIGGKFVYDGLEFTVFKIEPRSPSRPSCIRCNYKSADGKLETQSFYAHDIDVLKRLAK